jgi:hypothetical protein
LAAQPKQLQPEFRTTALPWGVTRFAMVAGLALPVICALYVAQISCTHWRRTYNDFALVAHNSTPEERSTRAKKASIAAAKKRTEKRLTQQGKSAQHVDCCAFLLLNWVVNKVNSRCAMRSTVHPIESSSA